MIIKKRVLIFILILILFSILVYAPLEIVERSEVKSEVSIKCHSDIGNVKSVKARIVGGQECTKISGWLYESLTNKVMYKCLVSAGQKVTIECYVDPNISWTKTQSQSAGVAQCTAEGPCRWGVENCEGKFDSNCNCIDTPNDNCPPICTIGSSCTTSQNCPGTFDSGCNCIDTPNDNCPLTCPAGQYLSGTCKQCGGVKICGTTYYCGVDNDKVCPSQYGANCNNNPSCNDHTNNC